MSSFPLRLGLDALDALARGADEVPEGAGGPAIVVVPDGLGRVDLDGLAARLASLPCVLVAEPGAPAGLATVVDVQPDEATWAATLAGIEAHPQAAIALALLLRGGDRRTIDEGLVAESATYSMLEAGPEFAAWRAGRPKRPVPHGPDRVLVERQHDVLRITFNRPDRHNAYGRAMRDALAEALTLAVVDGTVTAVELHGAGRSFSSGGDLDEFGDRPDPVTAHVVRLTRSPARLLARLHDRVTSYLHGSCLGAGIELPAFGRRVVAAADTVIGLPELDLGLVPGAGGTVSVPRRIGRHRTALLALTGLRVDAETARAWGLVDEIGGPPA